LLKKGLRNVWLRGAFPKQPNQARVVGTAFTLRFVPAREDLATPASWASPISTRTAIEAMEEGVVATGLPVWCAGAAAPASVASLTFVNWQEPIACGGVAIFPGDTIVADGDGAVVIPQAMLAETVEQAAEQEIQEGWIINEVRRGVPLPGLYPPNEETKARYAAWRKEQKK